MSHKENTNEVLDQLLDIINKTKLLKLDQLQNMIEEQNKTIRELKEQLETSRSLHDYATKELMILSRKVVEMGYNPSSGSRLCVKGFQSLKDDPLNKDMIEIYNDPIWDN
tara:strand:+ start:114 stop:443 length:330 start_codon:yes stop_codon:yes gene_type:complete